MAKFSIKVKNLEKGLRPSEYNIRDNGFLTTCSGMVGRDEVLQAMDLLPRLDITDTFPYPQIFDFTVMTIICSETDIYEWVDGALVLKLTVAGGLTWRAVDFNDFIYMSNGVVAVTRDPRTKVYSIAAQPITTAICNYNGQVIVTDKYVPPFILTSLTYALEVDEFTVTGACEITEGLFRKARHEYEYGPESTNITANEITEGVFRSSIHEYEYAESTDITANEVTEVVFRKAIKDYEYGPESTNTTYHGITEGMFRKALIEYEYGDVESTNITSTEITEGTHDQP